MRKLIVILNTMLARGQMWNPPAAAAEVARSTVTRRAASTAWMPTCQVSGRVKAEACGGGGAQRQF
jgi:hypothetical protein